MSSARSLCFAWLVAGGLAASVSAQPAPHLSALPPDLPWSGKSRELALPADSNDPWLTEFERSGGRDSPSYDDTVAWLRRLADAAPELEVVSLGRSGERREIVMVVATSGGSFAPEKIAASKKPVILVQGGIHAGEIDGKDAGMMLLRDLTVRGKLRPLLDKVELLFVPIFNVDGHERRGPYGRINQRGPETTGWRTTARNLNLNRDYAKADSPEMRAMLGAFNTWQPDLYIDIHVTDGIDYQYDVTWGYGGDPGWSPTISRFLEGVLDPPVQAKMRDWGHTPGYLVFSLDSDHPDQGHLKWQTAPPRFSDSYGAARHLPTILVENHSLKSYQRRVLGTYVFLAGVLETVGANAAAFEQAIANDRAARRAVLPLRYDLAVDAPGTPIELAAVKYEIADSPAAGKKVVWTGVPETRTIRRAETVRVAAEGRRPKAYLVPPQWTEVIARLRAHGIGLETLMAPHTAEVELSRIGGWKLATEPFEGRVPVALLEPPKRERRTMNFPIGTVRVTTDQPLGDLAMLLLEPESEDSLFQWGFFLEILTSPEYVEPYVMAPMAEKMLAADPTLAAEFAERLKDPAFAADPQARLQFFYQRTPYYDDRHLLYPVARE